MFRSGCTGAFWKQESYLILLYWMYRMMDHSYFFSVIQKKIRHIIAILKCNISGVALTWYIISNDPGKLIPNGVDLFLRLKLWLKLNTNLLFAWKPYWSYTKLLVFCTPIHTVDLRTLIWYKKTLAISTLLTFLLLSCQEVAEKSVDNQRKSWKAKKVKTTSSKRGGLCLLHFSSFLFYTEVNFAKRWLWV